MARDRSFIASRLPEEIKPGDNQVAKISFRDLEYRDRASEWKSPHWDDLRRLALQFWMGSEHDIALVRIIPNPSPWPVMRIYQVYQTSTSQAMKRLIGATWNDLQSYHELTCKDIDFDKVIALLLSYYNGVFFDDAQNLRSRVYLQLPMPNQPGEEICISRAYGTDEVYKKRDYWTPFLDLFYQGMRKPDGSQA